MAKHTLGNPPQSSDQEVTDLSRWVQQELQKILNKFEGGEAFRYEELHAPPEKLRDGMQAYADGTDWNPGAGEGLYIYVAGAWQKVTTGSGFLSNAYDEVTDGTTPAQASGGDTLKFRATSPITVVTESNHVTHGDNVLHALSLALLDPITVLALDDYIIVRDTSGTIDAKILVSDGLKIINVLTEETSVDGAADFLMMFDTSAAAVRKVKPDNISSGWTSIASGSLSGSNVDIGSIPATYKELRLILINASMSADQNLNVLFSDDGGSTFMTGDSMAIVGTTNVIVNDGTAFSMYASNILAAQTYSLQLDVFRYADAVEKRFWGSGSLSNGGGAFITGILNDTGVINFIRLDPSAAATFDAGTYELWGRK